MPAKDTLDLLSRIYRLMDRDPSAFDPGPSGHNAYSNRLAACISLRLAANGLQRWAEKACNGIPRYDAKARQVLNSWTDADETAKDKAQARYEAKAREALAVIFGDKLAGLHIEFQRDPRGAMVKVYRKDRAESGNPDLWV
jgi:hypothetical protein